jgi:hypothetical protein
MGGVRSITSLLLCPHLYRILSISSQSGEIVSSSLGDSFGGFSAGGSVPLGLHTFRVGIQASIHEDTVVVPEETPDVQHNAQTEMALLGRVKEPVN